VAILINMDAQNLPCTAPGVPDLDSALICSCDDNVRAARGDSDARDGRLADKHCVREKRPCRAPQENEAGRPVDCKVRRVCFFFSYFFREDEGRGRQC
jgi:hypothetical protein